MSAIATPQVSFTPQFIAFCEAALDLNNAQLGNAAAVPTTPKAAPKAVKPKSTPKAAAAPKAADNGDLGFGFKADGTPRKKADPVWLRNGKAAATAAPKAAKPKAAKSTPKAAPTIALPTIDDSPAWRSELARNGSTQHIRILAAELALFGAKSRKLTVELTAKHATKGAASDHYQSLALRVKAKGLDIRNGSDNWKLASAIITRANVA